MRRPLVLAALACAACSSDPSFREDDLREEFDRRNPDSAPESADTMVEIFRPICDQDEDARRDIRARAIAEGDTELPALIDAACPLDG